MTSHRARIAATTAIGGALALGIVAGAARVAPAAATPADLAQSGAPAVASAYNAVAENAGAHTVRVPLWHANYGTDRLGTGIAVTNVGDVTTQATLTLTRLDGQAVTGCGAACTVDLAGGQTGYWWLSELPGVVDLPTEAGVGRAAVVADQPLVVAVHDLAGVARGTYDAFAYLGIPADSSGATPPSRGLRYVPFLFSPGGSDDLPPAVGAGPVPDGARLTFAGPAEPVRGGAVPAPSNPVLPSAGGLLGVRGNGQSDLYVLNLNPSEPADIVATFHGHMPGAPVPMTVTVGASGQSVIHLADVPALQAGPYAASLAGDHDIAVLAATDWPSSGGRALYGETLGGPNPTADAVVPVVFKDAGGRCSLITIQNTDATSAATVDMAVHATNGGAPLVSRQYLIAAGSARTLRLCDDEDFMMGLPFGFVGAMRITDTGGARLRVQALIDYTNSVAAVSGFDGLPVDLAATVLRAPITFSAWSVGAVPGTTPMVHSNLAIHNPGAAEIDATVTYTGTRGVCDDHTYRVGPLPVPARGTVLIDPLELDALPVGCVASARIEADGPVMAVVLDQGFWGQSTPTPPPATATSTASPSDTPGPSPTLPISGTPATPTPTTVTVQPSPSATGDTPVPGTATTPATPATPGTPGTPGTQPPATGTTGPQPTATPSTSATPTASPSPTATPEIVSLAAYAAFVPNEAGRTVRLPLWRSGHTTSRLTTGIAVTNVGDRASTVTVSFRDANCRLIEGCGADCTADLAPGASEYWWPPDIAALPHDTTSSYGSAAVESSEPLVVALADLSVANDPARRMDGAYVRGAPMGSTSLPSSRLKVPYAARRSVTLFGEPAGEANTGLVALNMSPSAIGVTADYTPIGGGSGRSYLASVAVDCETSFYLPVMADLSDGDYAAVIEADGPVSAYARTDWPSRGAAAMLEDAYQGPDLVVPVVAREYGPLGELCSVLAIQNTGATAPADAVVQLYRMGGATVIATRSVTIQPSGSALVRLCDPAAPIVEFAGNTIGWARVRAADGSTPLAVHAFAASGTNARAVAGYGGLPGGLAGRQLFAPMVHAAWPASQIPSGVLLYSQIAIVNPAPAGQDGTVTVTYTGVRGDCAGQTFTQGPVPLGGSTGILLDPIGGAGVPEGCLAAARLDASAPVLAVVLDAGYPSSRPAPPTPTTGPTAGPTRTPSATPSVAPTVSPGPETGRAYLPFAYRHWQVPR